MTTPPAPADRLAGEVRERLAAVRARIAAARARSPRAASEVAVLAVTKGFGFPAVGAALAAGLEDLGENYAQELRAKAAQAEAAGLEPRWHMIGQLQRNKVRLLAGRVRCWQSVDRLPLGRELARRDPGAAVLVQCNLSGDPHRGGCDLAAAPALVAELGQLGLTVRGLMGVAPMGPPESARDGFRALVERAEELALPVRSIGMSTDLEVAVEEGSTHVRIGSALFGARPDATPGAAVDDAAAGEPGT